MFSRFKSKMKMRNASHKRERSYHAEPASLSQNQSSLEDQLPECIDSPTKLGAAIDQASRTNGSASKIKQGTYQYTPLDPNKKQIRVLSIQPKDGDSNDSPEGELLQCTLERVELDDYIEDYRVFLSETTPATQEGHSEGPTERLREWKIESCLRKGSRINLSRLREKDDYLPFRKSDQVLYERFAWGDYVALSYVWGDPTDRRDILLGDYRFSITTNLHQALLHLRDSYQIREQKLLVWTDAICINQADLAERATEVKRMALIYSECLQTRAWLGRPDRDVDVHLPQIRKLLKRILHGNIIYNGHDIVALMEEFGIAAHMDTVLSFISPLLNNPYWERMWIAQEIILSPSCLFWYGDAAFSSSEIVLMGLIWKDITLSMRQDTMSAVRRVMPFLARIDHRRWRLQDKQQYNARFGWHTSSLVRLSRTSEAFDSRDKVYGLMGLLPESTFMLISPHIDYNPSNSFRDTFTKFTKACFQTDGSLGSVARVPRNHKGPAELPSWVFDLNPQEFEHDAVLHMEELYAANQGIPDADFIFSNDDSLLFCAGVIVDAVSSLGTCYVYLLPAWKRQLVQGQGEGPNKLSLETWSRSETDAALTHEIQRTPEPYADYTLTLSRVLERNSLSNNPWILQLPWVEEEVIAEYRSLKHRPSVLDRDQPMQRLAASSHISTLFQDILHPTARFTVGRKPLRNYFTANQIDCADFETFNELAGEIVQKNNDRRLFTTRTGLLGTTPYYTRLGDVVAVLSACDMPLILRPKRAHFKVVGGCFVEGLMKGEVAEGIKEGKYEMREIVLC